MNVKSPITGTGNVLLEKEISSSFFVDAYEKQLDTDVKRFFKDTPAVGLYRCLDTNYRFFYPFSITGDDTFYQELQKFSWYYMDEKWEHGVATAYIKKNDRVLEIGCARGGFLKKIMSKGAVPEGLEMNSDALAECKKNGLSVYPDSIEFFSKKKGENYDVVCSFQVLEHVPEVKSFIESSLSSLKTGGRMIVSVPNNDSIIMETADGGPLNGPPHHMSRWDINSLISLQDYFNIRVVAVHIEPLQKYHLGFAIRIANRAVEMKLTEKAGMFSFLFKKFARLIVYVAISSVSKYIVGHTILVVFKKNHVQ